MAINKKLIHFNKYADFKKELDSGNILDKSIVFIKDKKQIYTHGEFYDCTEADWTSEEGESGFIANKPFGNKNNIVLSTNVTFTYAGNGVYQQGTSNIFCNFDLKEGNKYKVVITGNFSYNNTLTLLKLDNDNFILCSENVINDYKNQNDFTIVFTNLNNNFYRLSFSKKLNGYPGTSSRVIQLNITSENNTIETYLPDKYNNPFFFPFNVSFSNGSKPNILPQFEYNTVSGKGNFILGDGNSSNSSNKIKGNNNNVSGSSNLINGNSNIVSNNENYINGNWNNIGSKYNHVIGNYNKTPESSTLVDSIMIGQYLESNKSYETILGKYNKSNEGDNVIFSVGNGSSTNRHNSLEIDSNGKIYIPNTYQGTAYYNRPMVCLQELLHNAGLI